MTCSRDHLDTLIEEAVRQAPPLAGLPEPSAEATPDDALLRYLDDPPRDPMAAERLRQQIAANPWSRSILDSLRQALLDAATAQQEPDGTARWANRIRFTFARARHGLQFLWGTVQPTSLQAAAVPTRGHGPSGPTEEATFFDFEHDFGPVQVRVQVEHLPGDQLDLQIALQDTAGDPRRLRVDLADASGALLDSQPVERGLARFAALPPESHELFIRAGGTTVGQIRVDVCG